MSFQRTQCRAQVAVGLDEERNQIPYSSILAYKGFHLRELQAYVFLFLVHGS